MKMNRMSIWLVLALVVLAGCAKQPEAVKYLVLGTSAEFPPFVSKSEAGEAAGEMVGLDVEIAMAIADKAGLPLQIENMEFNDLLPALAAGKVDLVMAAMPVTEARRRMANFSTPYYNATPVAAIVAGGPVPQTKEELKGLKIGAQIGTADLEAAEAIAGAGAAKAFPSVGEAVAALMANQVECVILDDQLVPRFAAQNELLMRLEVPFDPEVYGVAVKKGNAELLAKVNETLVEIVADGRYDRWLDQWVVGPAPAAE